MGMVMAGVGAGVMAGPPLGGWLYELGGIALPFLFVAGLAFLDGLARWLLITPPPLGERRSVSPLAAFRVPAIVVCALAVVAGAGTISMLEPVLPLYYQAQLSFAPGEIGTLFGVAALSSTLLHPVYGRLSDRHGGRRLTLLGLGLSAALLPLMALPNALFTVAPAMMILWGVLSMTVTPSLAFMGEAATAAGLESYGLVYGIYNMAWAAGMLFAPAAGGFLYERLGFGLLCWAWAGSWRW
jgi:MFS family permease